MRYQHDRRLRQKAVASTEKVRALVDKGLTMILEGSMCGYGQPPPYRACYINLARPPRESYVRRGFEVLWCVQQEMATECAVMLVMVLLLAGL